MYYPYLRGKQNEILTLRELSSFLSSSRKVLPILEPVVKPKSSARFGKNFFQVAEAGYPLGVVENPSKGDFASDHKTIRENLVKPLADSFGNVIPVFLIGPSTAASEIRIFLKRHSRPVGLVHSGMSKDLAGEQELQSDNIEFQVFRRSRTSQEYRTRLSTGRSIILSDGFTRYPTNSDYPEREFFSDVLSTYSRDGFDGFGDFLIVGDQFSRTGGAAIAVAIHLTNLREGTLWVHHFLSTRKKGRGIDTPGKFLEALKRTVEFIESPQNSLISEGCRDFLSLAKRRHFPGLGVVKKLSMKHHIELVASAL